MKFFARHPKDSAEPPSNECGCDRSSRANATVTDDTSDETLALAAANGGRDAFAMLIERHYERIHRLAWRLTGSRSDAEDVAQDVCIKLATAIRSFRGESAFGTWVWRIAHNATTDFLRQRQRMKPTEASELMALVDEHGQYTRTARGQRGQSLGGGPAAFRTTTRGCYAGLRRGYEPRGSRRHDEVQRKDRVVALA